MSINPFLLSGLLAGWAASIACGLVGPYVITRRIAFLSGAIAHIALGGVGMAIFARHHFGWDWLEPIYGASVAAVIAAVILGWVHERVSERMDTLIGAMWAMGMAIGILLIKFTPGYHTELMSFLFGDLATVHEKDVVLMTAMNGLIVATVLLFHKQILAVCVDPQQAQLQGVPVLGTNIVLLVLVALTVICLINVVGLILVLALLTLPAATAGHHLKRMVPMMFAAMSICLVLTTVPRIAVYGTRISPEAAIVLSAGGVYLISVMVRRQPAKAS